MLSQQSAEVPFHSSPRPCTGGLSVLLALKWNTKAPLYTYMLSSPITGAPQWAPNLTQTLQQVLWQYLDTASCPSTKRALEDSFWVLSGTLFPLFSPGFLWDLSSPSCCREISRDGRREGKGRRLLHILFQACLLRAGDLPSLVERLSALCHLQAQPTSEGLVVGRMKRWLGHILWGDTGGHLKGVRT